MTDAHSSKLVMWTVYNSPTDFPGQYVARQFEMEQPTSHHFAHNDFAKVQGWVRAEAARKGLAAPVRMARQPGDDPVIVEVWM